MNAAVAQIDVYSHQRADLLERLGCLVGGTTWREPSGGGTNMIELPMAHRFAAALAFARECNPADTGPDILEALATGTQRHRIRIVAELTAALWLQQRRAKKYPKVLPQIAADAFMGCCGVLPKGKPIGVKPEDYAAIIAVAEEMLWQAAERALRKLRRKLR